MLNHYYFASPPVTQPTEQFRTHVLFQKRTQKKKSIIDRVCSQEKIFGCTHPIIRPQNEKSGCITFCPALRGARTVRVAGCAACTAHSVQLTCVASFLCGRCSVLFASVEKHSASSPNTRLKQQAGAFSSVFGERGHALFR